MKINASVWRSVGKTIILVSTLAALAYLLYFHRLQSLLPGYSAGEVATYKQSLNWHNISHTVSSATYLTVVWAATALGHQGIGATRAISASMGIIAVAMFYGITRLRYSFWISFTGTLLFATSAGFLHAARLGTPAVLQFGILAFIGAVLWYRKAVHHRILLGYGIAALFGTLLYIPGMIWFELFGCMLMFSGIRRQLTTTRLAHALGWGAVFAATIVPLLYFGAQNGSALREIAGLPDNLALLREFPSNLWHSVLSVTIHSTGEPQYWVGHAPLLNVVELAVGLIGGYAYLAQERSKRALFLAGSLVLGIVLASLGGSVTLFCITPILYLFIVEGLRQLLTQWTTVFPRNPLARATGISLLAIMLFFSVLYQTRSYFVAWPNNIQTRQTFSHQPGE